MDDEANICFQSIDLTKVPLPPRLPTKNGDKNEEQYDYSSREMKPASLILRDLLRAHSIFLMHHDSSLSSLFVRKKRSRFVAALSRYWDLFLSTWNVMLHGNPARDVLGGINIAASGELGVGVGEEDRGSGERDVLEGLVGRIEGLVDLVVSKFGDDPDATANGTQDAEVQPWLGTGQEPGPADGAIFLGTGVLSRKSLRDVTHWMEDLYTWGEHAYGVIESPTSVRRATRRRAHKGTNQKPAESQQATLSAPTNAPTEGQQPSSDAPGIDNGQPPETEDGKLDKMVSYLKLGYGTYWSLPGTSGDSPKESSTPQPPASETKDTNSKEALERPNPPARTPSYDAAAHYLIGLKGEIEEGSDADMSPFSDDDTEHNSRTVLRTVHVELESEATGRPEATIIRNFEHPGSELAQSQIMGNMMPGYDSHDLNKAKKLRVVVYVNRPFIFTFLFQLRTDSLAWDTLYRSLHHQLAPLRKPLLQSAKYRPDRPTSDSAGSNSIYDLIWDPKQLTVHSSIPNIPDNYLDPSPWTRPDALNTHLHILAVHTASSSDATSLERTQKTQRGWWVVWTRLLDSQRRDESTAALATIHELGSDIHDPSEEKDNSEQEPPSISKEIFLIRRASDHAGLRNDSSGGEGAGRLAQGIGVDTRRYVEELLSLL